MGIIAVDGSSMRWVNGREVYESMTPAFRENFGGDEEAVADYLSRYWLRSLWRDDSSGRRIDHVRADPGYLDLSEAYHDSVEEILFLSGEAHLSAEGTFVAGDYFWRPPGWVHKAWSEPGFEAIMMMEGEDVSEGSGPVTRVVQPDELAGEYVGDLVGESRYGPRGYVRRLETRFLPWRQHDDTVTGLGGGDASAEPRSQVLSLNEETGARSVLCRLPAGFASAMVASPRDRFLVNTEGTISADGVGYGACSLIHIPAGEAPPKIDSAEGATVLVKVGGVVA